MMATRVLGLGALKAKLRKLPAAVENSIMSEMEKSAEEVVATAKNLAPVKSGDLMLSISWTWGDPPPGSMTLSKKAQRHAHRKRKRKSYNLRPAPASTGLGKGRLTIYAGDANAFYARFVEFGTKASPARASRRNMNFRRSLRMTRAYAAHHATRAQPFFFPAWRAHRKKVKARISRAITRGAKQIARR